MSHTIVDCSSSDWAEQLHSRLFFGEEVDLINFEPERHLNSCMLLSEAFKAELLLDRDLNAKLAHFRRADF